MRITDRYATAINSSCLTVDERTTRSDTDVLGAMGLADKYLEEMDKPLAVPLTRLFMGDNSAGEEIVRLLTAKIRGKAPSLKLKITIAQAEDMAKACLAWHRNGTCEPCGGHGVLKIPGTTTLGAAACKACKPSAGATTGTGKRPFEREFHPSMRELAAWVVAEMEREQAQAGAEAMKTIAGYLEAKTWLTDAAKM